VLFTQQVVSEVCDRLSFPQEFVDRERKRTAPVTAQSLQTQTIVGAIDEFAAEFRLLRERFSHVHQEGLASLRTGDMDYLARCLLLERIIINEQAQLTARLIAATVVGDRRPEPFDD
jgi:hypothetical protein